MTSRATRVGRRSSRRRPSAGIVFAAAAALLAACASALRGSPADDEPIKLDPVLRERLDARDARDRPEPGPASDPEPPDGTELDVLVALSEPATDATLDELGGLGLQVRSVIGEILTAGVDLADVEQVAGHPSVVKIEAGTPLGVDHDGGLGHAPDDFSG